MSQQLYVGTVMAFRRRGPDMENQIQSFTLLAASEDEALGYAYRWMEERFPTQAGYTYSGKLTGQLRATVAEWLAAYDEDST